MMDKTHDLEAAAEEGGRKWLAAESSARMMDNVDQLVEGEVERISNRYGFIALGTNSREGVRDGILAGIAIGKEVVEQTDTITSLQAQLEKAREALKEIDASVSHGRLGDWSLALSDIRKFARAALGEQS